MPETVNSATAPTVAKPANQSNETQFGSMASMKTYSAGVAKPVGCAAAFGFGVRDVLRMLVLTKRVS